MTEEYGFEPVTEYGFEPIKPPPVVAPEVKKKGIVGQGLDAVKAIIGGFGVEKPDVPAVPTALPPRFNKMQQEHANRILPQPIEPIKLPPDQSTEGSFEGRLPRGGIWRPDGTIKGSGYFGALPRPDGQTSTELAIGIEFDGHERLVPLIVPTLTRDELDHVLSGFEPTQEIMRKVNEHAKARISQGLSPFAQLGEQMEPPPKLIPVPEQQPRMIPGLGRSDPIPTVYSPEELSLKRKELEASRGRVSGSKAILDQLDLESKAQKVELDAILARIKQTQELAKVGQFKSVLEGQFDEQLKEYNALFPLYEQKLEEIQRLGGKFRKEAENLSGSIDQYNMVLRKTPVSSVAPEEVIDRIGGPPTAISTLKDQKAFEREKGWTELNLPETLGRLGVPGFEKPKTVPRTPEQLASGRIRADAVRQISKNTGMRPTFVEENYDALTKELGVRTNQSRQEFIGSLMMVGIAAGLVTVPLATIANVLAFSGWKELESYISQILKGEKPKLFEGRELIELLGPLEEKDKALVETLEYIVPGLLTAKTMGYTKAKLSKELSKKLIHEAWEDALKKEYGKKLIEYKGEYKTPGGKLEPGLEPKAPLKPEAYGFEPIKPEPVKVAPKEGPTAPVERIKGPPEAPEAIKRVEPMPEPTPEPPSKKMSLEEAKRLKGEEAGKKIIQEGIKKEMEEVDKLPEEEFPILKQPIVGDKVTVTKPFGSIKAGEEVEIAEVDKETGDVRLIKKLSPTEITDYGFTRAENVERVGEEIKIYHGATGESMTRTPIGRYYAEDRKLAEGFGEITHETTVPKSKLLDVTDIETVGEMIDKTGGDLYIDPFSPIQRDTTVKHLGSQYNVLERMIGEKQRKALIDRGYLGIRFLDKTGSTKHPTVVLFRETLKKKEDAERAGENVERVIVTDPTQVQEIKNSIAEGEMILESGKKTNGEKMSQAELDAVQRSVDSAKKKIGVAVEPAEDWNQGWTEEHDTTAGVAAIPGEPLEVYKDGKAILTQVDPEGYSIQREDGSFILNKETKTAVFDDVEQAKKAFLAEEILVKRAGKKEGVLGKAKTEDLGLVFIDGKQRYFTSSTPGTRGLKKGKVQVTLTDGKKVFVDKTDIKREAKVAEKPKVEEVKEEPKAVAKEPWEMTQEDMVDVPEKKFPQGSFQGELYDQKGDPLRGGRYIGNVYYHPTSKKVYVGLPKEGGRGEVVKLLPGTFDLKQFEKVGVGQGAGKPINYWRFKKVAKPEPKKGLKEVKEEKAKEAVEGRVIVPDTNITAIDQKGKTAKIQKEYLLDAVDEAIKQAPEQGTGENVIVEVPKDGTFRLINNKESLREFKKVAEKRFPGSAPKGLAKHKAHKAPVKPTGRRYDVSDAPDVESIKAYEIRKFTTADVGAGKQKGGGGRVMVGEGYYTNGSWLVKGEVPDDFELRMGYEEQNEQETPMALTDEMLTNAVPSQGSLSKGSVLAEFHTSGSKLHLALIGNAENYVMVPAEQLDLVLQKFPNAIITFGKNEQPVIFRDEDIKERDGLVGIVMPIAFKAKGEFTAGQSFIQEWLEENNLTVPNSLREDIAKAREAIKEPEPEIKEEIEETPESFYDSVLSAVEDYPISKLSEYERSISESHESIVIPGPKRIKIENLLAEQIDNPTEGFGGKVEQVGTGKVGTSVFEIARPYGKLIYNEATGELSAIPDDLTSNLLSSRNVEFGVDKTLLLQTISKDIVNNDLAGTIANETLQNSLDAFPKGAEDRTITITIDSDNGPEVIDDQGMRYQIPETKVIIEDNGTGMTSKEVEKNLLRLGAKGKEGTMTRGGYGLAKAGFILTPRRTVITTVKDGVMTVVTGTKEQFFGVRGAGSPNMSISESTQPNGTKFELNFYGNEQDAKADNSYALTGYDAHQAFQKYTAGIYVPGVNIVLDWGGRPTSVWSRPPEDLPQIFRKIPLNIEGSKLTLYFVPDPKPSRYKSYDKTYQVKVEILNKGLPLFGINKVVAGLWVTSTWKVLANFEKTPDVRSIDYPFIRNRTELNNKIEDEIDKAIQAKIKDINEQTFQLHVKDFKEMIENSPEIDGVKVLIPFTESAEFDKAKDLILSNQDIVSGWGWTLSGLASIFKSFKNILSKIGEGTIDLSITVDPGVHGFRSNPKFTGAEIFAINPFAITSDFELSAPFKELVGAGYDSDTAMAANLTHTMVHELAHRKQPDHGEAFAGEMARLYMKMSHGQLTRLEKEATKFYEEQGENLRKLQSDFSGMGGGGSRFRESNLAVRTPGEYGGGVVGRRGVQRGGEEEARGEGVESPELLSERKVKKEGESEGGLFASIEERAYDEVIYAHEYKARGVPLTDLDKKVRQLAYGVKSLDKDAITEVARDIARKMPGDKSKAILIPIPDHTGQKTSTLLISNEISRITGAKVKDILARKPGPSQRSARISGTRTLTPEEFEMEASQSIPDTENVYFIDNVISSGATIRAARDAVGGGRGLVYAKLFHGGAKYSAGEYSTGAGGAAAPRPHETPDRMVNIIEMPEMVELFNLLSHGKFPIIKKKLRAFGGLASGLYRTGKGKIELAADIFENPAQARATLAHEIFHFIDDLPDYMLRRRGNIFGRIATLRNYLLKYLEAYEGAPGPLTDADRARFMKDAREAIKLEKASEEEKAKPFEEIKLTPDDIKAIWNDVEARAKSRRVYDFIVSLSEVEKNQIVREAMKGIVSETNQRKFRMSMPVEGRPFKDWDQRLRDVFNDLIKEELEKRQVFTYETMMSELKNLSMTWKPFTPIPGDSYTKYRFSPQELYADAGSVLLNNPALLAEKAPHFYKAFFNYLHRKPEVKQAYDDIQARIGEGEEAVLTRRRERVQAMFKRGENVLDELRKPAPYNILKSLKLAFISKREEVLSLKRSIEKRQGKKLDPDVDPDYWTEDLPYISSPIFQMVRDINNTILKPAHEKGITQSDIGEYFKYRREATERARMANPGGFTAADALKQMDFLKRQLGDEKFDALTDLVKKDWEISKKDIFPILEKSRAFDEETMELIKNSEEYAPFAVIDYFNKKYGPHITAKIYRQIGTFKEIINPFLARVLKNMSLVRMAERKMIAEKVVDFLRKEAPDLVTPAETKWTGSYHEIIEPEDPSLGLIIYPHLGKMKGFYVPKSMANIFKGDDIIKIAYVSNILRFLNAISTPIKALFLTHNPNWWVWNFQKDSRAFGKQVPGISLIPGKDAYQIIKAYIKAIPDAYKDVFKNVSTDDVREMYNMKALGVGRFWAPSELSSEGLLDKIVQSFGDDPVKYRDHIEEPFRRLIEYLKAGVDHVDKPGAFFERLPKIAAYKFMKEGSDFPEKKISHIVKKRAGSPDFWEKGGLHHFYNSLFWFSNAGKEGMRASWEAAREDPFDYTIKTLKYDIFPKLLMVLAGAGAFGLVLERLMNNIPERDKMNYLTPPIGETADGKTVYLVFPHDFQGQIIGGLFYKIATLGVKKKIPRAVDLGQIMDYMAGGLPYEGLNPYLGLSVEWKQYLTNKNPYDPFTGRYIFPDTVYEAKGGEGSKQRIQSMIKRTWNQLGGGIAYRFKGRTVKEVQGELEKALGIPFIGPFLTRFVRVSDVGRADEYRDMSEEVRGERANELLVIDKAIMKNFVDPKTPTAQPQEVYNALIKDGSIKRHTFNEFLVRLTSMLAFKLGTPESDAILRARSNEELISILMLAKEKEKNPKKAVGE